MFQTRQNVLLSTSLWFLPLEQSFSHFPWKEILLFFFHFLLLIFSIIARGWVQGNYWQDFLFQKWVSYWQFNFLVSGTRHFDHVFSSILIKCQSHNLLTFPPLLPWQKIFKVVFPLTYLLNGNQFHSVLVR